MYRLFFLTLISTLLFTPKAFAHNDVEMANVTRMIGWMQATCTYYKTGSLSYSNAQIGLKVALKILTEDHSLYKANTAKEITLEKYPSCVDIMP